MSRKTPVTVLILALMMAAGAAESDTAVGPAADDGPAASFLADLDCAAPSATPAPLAGEVSDTQAQLDSIFAPVADACLPCPGRPACCWKQAIDCCYGSQLGCNFCW
jgi:hypothetical protein